ncbi:MAG: peptidoglycan DD-metalloendopeptidase family protein, partial [bacterium]|nr:peptidoglycan DD-metalloendopeptidase family protein [bacterium]
SLSHALWALVLLRLVLPTDLSVPWSARSILDRSALSAHVEGFDTELRPFAAAAGEQDREDPLAGRAGDAPTAGAVSVVLAIAWAFGVVVLAGLLVRKRRSYRELVRRSQPLGEARLQTLLERWREELGIRREVRLLGSEARVSPFTVGLVRPVIVLPRALVDHPERRLAECALAHELVHVKRWDDGWLGLQSIIQALYFFHPVVWVSCRRLNEERERICDGLVLARGLVPAATYARSLVAVLKLQLAPPGPVPAFGNRKRRFIMRLEEIHNSKRRSAVHPTLPMLFALVLGAFLLPMAATGFPPQASKEEPAVAEQPAVEQSSAVAMTLINPLPEGKVTSGFGPRIDPFTRKRVHHQGIDVAAPRGTPILAPAPGVVETATEQYEEGERFGTVVVLDHGNGLKTLFSHLESFTVLVGRQVAPGDPIATVGSTGVSSGPHLHFEVLRDGQPVDPGKFVGEWQGR